MKRTVVTILISIIIFSSCKTVPITGRRTINFVGDERVLPTSFAQYKSFLRENKLSKDTKKTNQIKEIGARISKAVDRYMRAHGMEKEAESYRWEFNLIEDPTINAWCMPGGKVVFYTGILPIAKNEDGIAAIMGHEVAHAFAKHGQERMSTGMIQQLGGVATQIYTGTQIKDPKKAQMFNMLYGVSSGLGMLKFSRTHEQEADRLGLIFMIMAGYNGTEATEVWVRMSQRAGAGQAPPEILSTHPSNASRINDLKAYLPKAKVLAKKFNAESLK